MRAPTKTVPTIEASDSAIGWTSECRANKTDAMKRTLRTAFAVVAGGALAPSAGAVLTVRALLSLSGVSALVSISTHGLVGPLLSVIIETVVFVVATVISLAAIRHREAWVRSRFEQHLAPAVVRRILETPGMLKLAGERREVTALFTDVEGFTTMTHHVDPVILVDTLDNYFEGMATIIIAHGGMIDKIVGDAVHALFNAPNDLRDHPQKAVECAIALRSWSEIFRHRPEVATIGFGRTRIGLETGPAIVGDVGIRAKLDYTAHGDAVNVAARLEAANKELGSSICVGPVAASRCDESLLRPLGKIIVRGRECAMTVFEPRRSNVPRWPQGEHAALRLNDQDPPKATFPRRADSSFAAAQYLTPRTEASPCLRVHQT